VGIRLTRRDRIIDKNRGIEPEQAKMAQISQCDLLHQPDLMQCGIYCEAIGFIAPHHQQVRLRFIVLVRSPWRIDR
jgi:hypothetical protein